MPVKIRLQRKGRRKKPFYHIVIADARAPRDGRFIEQIGSYNPMTSPATIDLDVQRALDWLNNGAQPTETARAILRFKGVLYKKHLDRGVKKGALTQEQAEKMYDDFMIKKNERVAARFEASKQAESDRMKAISGTAAVVVEEVIEEATDADQPATDDQRGSDVVQAETIAEAEETITETATEEVAEEVAMKSETTAKPAAVAEEE